jgi:hypothetical protein
MPYEEYYNPADEVDIRSDDNYAKNKAAEEIKVLDKLYQKFYKSVQIDDSKFNKRIAVQCYGSGQIGSRIRNAVTGQYYNYVVGSVDEDLVFKVIDAVGRNGRKDPLFLFYDTPEQYENHQFVKLSQGIKEKWYQRNLDARQKGLE